VRATLFSWCRTPPRCHPLNVISRIQNSSRRVFLISTCKCFKNFFNWKMDTLPPFSYDHAVCGRGPYRSYIFILLQSYYFVWAWRQLFLFIFAISKRKSFLDIYYITCSIYSRYSGGVDGILALISIKWYYHRNTAYI